MHNKSSSNPGEQFAFQTCLLNRVPEALAATDENFIFTFWNKAAERTYGWTSEEIIGKCSKDILQTKVPNSSRDEVINKMLQDNAFDGEVYYRRKDGTYILTHSHICVLRDSNGEFKGTITAFNDVTERKWAEEALRESKECLHAALSNAEAGMWIWDLNDKWQTTPQINILFGRSADEPLITFEEFSSQIHNEDLKRIKEEWNKTIENGLPYNQEYRIIWPDGTMHWLASKGKVVTLPSGAQRFMGISFDITDRKYFEEEIQKAKVELEDKVRERTAQLADINQSLLAEIEERKRTEKELRSAQTNLRAMASEMIMADERSRQHFATDLHDTVVQTLGAAKLRSQLLQEFISEEKAGEYSELQNLLSQSIKEARQIMAELNPPVLQQLGFIPAMGWLVEQVGSQSGLHIKFRERDSYEPLAYEVQVLLFQASRELLTNVVKHSQAREVLVSITQIGEFIRVTVKDNGIGFHGKISFREDHSGFGLFSIRERLKHLGGHLMIKSKPGQRTSISMVLPRTI